MTAITRADGPTQLDVIYRRSSEILEAAAGLSCRRIVYCWRVEDPRGSRAVEKSPASSVPNSTTSCPRWSARSGSRSSSSCIRSSTWAWSPSSAGLGWTIQTHFQRLGDAAILSALTFTLAGSLYYCFSRGRAYSNGRVEAPAFAFDYVLYLGCLVLGLELGYLEFRFHLLQESWDHYLLLSAGVFFLLAYRFDNRFVLSLALSTLAGWFGVRLSHFPDSRRRLAADGRVDLRQSGRGGRRRALPGRHQEALPRCLPARRGQRAVCDAALGAVRARRRTSCTCSRSSVSPGSSSPPECGSGVLRSSSTASSTATSASACASLRDVNSFSDALAYVAVSSTIVIVSLVVLARRFGREE